MGDAPLALIDAAVRAEAGAKVRIGVIEVRTGPAPTPLAAAPVLPNPASHRPNGAARAGTAEPRPPRSGYGWPFGLAQS